VPTRPLYQYAIFVAVVSAMMVGVSALISAFFSVGLRVAVPTFVTTTVIIWAASMIYVIGEIINRIWHLVWIKRIGAVILGVVSISVSVVLPGFLLFLTPLSRVLIVEVSVSIIALLSLWGIFNHQLPPKITNLDVQINRSSRQGIRIVQLSDVHLDGITSTHWVRQLVETVNKLSPDIIVFTGDFLDISPDRVRDQLELIKSLNATIGKLAVSGNHDFYGDYNVFKTVMSDIGFQLIDNDHVSIGGIDFVGIADSDASRFGFYRADARLDFPSFPLDKTVVALSHRPDEFSIFSSKGITLQLSGHTHWGQIPPFNLFIRFVHTFPKGFAKINESMLYVSKGTGVWGPPMRLFGRSEIVTFTL